MKLVMNHFGDVKMNKTIGQRILNVLEKIGATASTTEKKVILGNALKCPEIGETLKRVLVYGLDPKKNYGISYLEEKPEDSATVQYFDISDNQPWVCLNNILDGKTRGNDIRISLEFLLSSCNDATAEIIRMIVHKDFRCGVSLKTLEKVWPNCPMVKPPYMRCSLPDDVNLDAWKWDKGIIVQLKADGSYCSAFIDSGSTVFVSRSGEIMPNDAIPELAASVKQILTTKDIQGKDLSGYRLHGEFLVEDENGKILTRQKGNGILNSIRQGGMLPNNHRVIYNVWDIVENYAVPYGVRFSILDSALEHLQCNNVRKIETHVAYSLEDAMELTKKFMSQGLEGSILKNPDSVYVNGTSKDQVKMKVECDADVIVTGFIEGKKGKKTENTFGALEYSSADGKVRGSVSGFTDARREMIDKNRQEYLGKIMTVKFNDLTKSKNSEHYALSHPRFVEFRDDKTEADDLERIQKMLKMARGLK